MFRLALALAPVSETRNTDTGPAKPPGKIEAQLKAEVADLMARAEATDAAEVVDGMSIRAASVNLSALIDLSGWWIDLVHGRRPPRGIVLDMDSSVSRTKLGKSTSRCLLILKSSGVWFPSWA